MGMTSAGVFGSGEIDTNSRKTVKATSDERTVNNDGNRMRHAYRVLSDKEKERMSLIKDLGSDFDVFLEGLDQDREITIARQKIEEAVMWAVKSITR